MATQSFLSRSDVKRHSHDTCKSSSLQYPFRFCGKKFLRADPGICSLHRHAEYVCNGMQQLSQARGMYPPRLLRTRISSDSGRCSCRHSDPDFTGSMQALRKNARNSSGGNRPVSSVYSDLYRHCVKSVLLQDALQRMCQERNCGDDMLGYGGRSTAAISLEKTA